MRVWMCVTCWYFLFVNAPVLLAQTHFPLQASPYGSHQGKVPSCRSPYQALTPELVWPTNPAWHPSQQVPGALPPLPPLPKPPGTALTAPNGTPTSPPTTPSPPEQTPPEAPEGSDTPEPVQDSFAQATERGTESGATYSPNMFGDIFGGRTCSATFRIVKPGRFDGNSITVLFPNAGVLESTATSPSTPTLTPQDPPPNPAPGPTPPLPPTPTPTPGPTPTTPPTPTPPGPPTPEPQPDPAPDPNPEPDSEPESEEEGPITPQIARLTGSANTVAEFRANSSSILISGPGAPAIRVPLGRNVEFSQPAPPGTVAPITESVAVEVTPEVNRLLQDLARPGEAIFLGVEQLNQLANAGVQIENLELGQATGSANPANPASLAYTIPVRSQTQRLLFLNLVNPSSGGVIGRTKASEDNNPLPRDRLIFNYDYFENVPLSVRTDVNRLAFGFEKTIFSHRNSIEVRLPFATTLSSDLVQDGITNTSRVELGNLRILLKRLIVDGERFKVAGGLGFNLPTADDTRVRLMNGTDLVRIHNEALVLTPYLATLWTPNERFFNQNWFAIDFDTGGNRLDVNADWQGLRKAGRIDEQPLLQLDTQLGYWLVRQEDPTKYVQGLAPFIELHYNASLGNSKFVRVGDYFIGDTKSNIHEFNFTVGAIVALRHNFVLSLGAVIPLGEDKFFDYQLGIRGNWYFGNRNRPGAPTTF